MTDALHSNENNEKSPASLERIREQDERMAVVKGIIDQRMASMPEPDIVNKVRRRTSLPQPQRSGDQCLPLIGSPSRMSEFEGDMSSVCSSDFELEDDDLSVFSVETSASMSSVSSKYEDRYSQVRRDLLPAPAVFKYGAANKYGLKIKKKFHERKAQKQPERRMDVVAVVKAPAKPSLRARCVKSCLTCEVCKTLVYTEFACSFCPVVLCLDCVSEAEAKRDDEPPRCRWCVEDYKEDHQFFLGQRDIAWRNYVERKAMDIISR